MARARFTVSGLLAVGMLAGCAGEVPTGSSEPLLQLDYTPELAEGSFILDGQALVFESRVLPEVIEVTIELRGMILLMTADRETGVFDVDGFAAQNGDDTQMLEEDIALVRALEVALTETYREHSAESPALAYLNRAITVWGQYSTTLPLTRIYHGRLDRSASLCGSVNRPGQGTSLRRWVAATHDCDSTRGDCSWWYGCERWKDNSTTDYVFMSMHPTGGCSDDTYFGNGSGSFRCYEPDHPGDNEYSYGACFGRCGGSCGGGTVFTRDCLDHDQCVRLGHTIASFWCDDEVTGATWDAMWGSDCSGVNFRVDYNWAGTSLEGNCPTSWNSTNDGCDVGCQFIDGDCFR